MDQLLQGNSSSFLVEHGFNIQTCCSPRALTASVCTKFSYFSKQINQIRALSPSLLEMLSLLMNQPSLLSFRVSPGSFQCQFLSYSFLQLFITNCNPKKIQGNVNRIHLSPITETTALYSALHCLFAFFLTALGVAFLWFNQL